jgi:hypothetical protein
VRSGSNRILQPANNTGNCLDARGDASASETIVQVLACTGSNNEE